MKTLQTMLIGPFAGCLLVLFLAGAVQAQTGQMGGQQQPMMQQPGPGLEVSDAELEKVAEAYMEIHEIRVDLQESLAGVTDPQSAQQMQEEAGAAMVQAVQDSGLNVEMYNQVMQEVQTNEALREQLTSMLEARH
ncbi:MAG: DUF4168 domain-containing protein [Desulfovibrionales bacterium]|nr:MAG: DUF4168 domain-containing protein [Desulfovibrionales bacterium]